MIIALYDRMANGALRSKMASLSHQNLPLSIFLERAELGYPAWTGSQSATASNDNIIAYLGVGIVSYKDDVPIDDGSIPDTDYEYRVNTDVITSIVVQASRNITPDNPATVTFNIDGRNYILALLV